MGGMVHFCIFTLNFHKIMPLFDLVQSKINVAVAVHESVLFVHSAAVVVRVSAIPCCTIAWQRHCLQLFQPWKCSLVSWHVATYLASLSLSLSFVINESSPVSLFHRCSFALKSYRNILCFKRVGTGVDLLDTMSQQPRRLRHWVVLRVASNQLDDLNRQ